MNIPDWAIALGGLYLLEGQQRAQQQVQSADTITVTRAQLEGLQREYDRRVQQEWNKRERELREEIRREVRMEMGMECEIWGETRYETAGEEMEPISDFHLLKGKEEILGKDLHQESVFEASERMLVEQAKRMYAK